MILISSILSFIGLVSVLFGTFLLLVQVIDFYCNTTSDLRACKQDIERLERQIKNLQCNRPS